MRELWAAVERAYAELERAGAFPHGPAGDAPWAYELRRVHRRAVERFQAAERLHHGYRYVPPAPRPRQKPKPRPRSLDEAVDLAAPVLRAAFPRKWKHILVMLCDFSWEVVRSFEARARTRALTKRSRARDDRGA